jgi:hypothetical protein
MSQRRNIVLLAVLIALVTLPSACGGSGDDSDGGDGAGDGGDAAVILGDASLDGVKSGVIGLSAHVQSVGGEDLDLEIDVSGPFHKSERQIPIMAVEVTAEGKVGGVQGDFDGGLTLFPKHGFLAYEGVDYEINPRNYGFAKEAFLPSRPLKGKKGQLFAFTVCLEEAAAYEIADFVENPTFDGTAKVDGTPTIKVSGDLDVSAVLDAMAELARKSPCRAQLAAAGRTAGEVEEAADDVRGAVEQAHFEAYVGDDGIPRKIVASLTAVPPGENRDKVKVDLEFAFSSINEAPEVKPPSSAKSILKWFTRFGLSEFEGSVIVTEPESLARILQLIEDDLGIPQL